MLFAVPLVGWVVVVLLRRSRRGRQDEQEIEARGRERDDEGPPVTGHGVVLKFLERFVGIAWGHSHGGKAGEDYWPPVISLVSSRSRPGKKKSSNEASAVMASGSTQATGASLMPVTGASPSGAGLKKAR